MARYNGPVCRLCRREGMKLFLKGERCYTEKCAIEKRNMPPGQHGRLRKAKMVGYGVQLREKQKVKRIYGVLEDQFRRYFEQAERTRGGITGETLLQLLERRLDNAVYRMGLATSRAQARQLVRHGHFLVNGKRVDIPSYSLKSGDTVIVREGSRKNPTILHAREEVKGRGIPEWISPEGEHGAQGGQHADARADQPARAGAADRRVVQQVVRVRAVRPRRCLSRSRLQQLFRPAASERATRTCRSGGGLPARSRKERDDMWKGFQRPKRLDFERETLTDRFGRFYAQPFERGFGTTIGNAAAPRAAVVDRRRGDHRGADRRRAARVLADQGRRRGRHRHHPQPQAAADHVPRRLHQDADAAEGQAGPGARVRHRSRCRRRDSGTGCAHRDHRRRRPPAHAAARQARPRLRLGRPQLRRGSRHRLDPDRLGALAGEEGQLPRRRRARRPDHRLRQAHPRSVDQRLGHAGRRGVAVGEADSRSPEHLRQPRRRGRCR